MADGTDAISKLITHLPPDKRRALARLLEPAPEPIAVVGIGCRLPGGASTPAAFWDVIVSGADAVTRVPPERVRELDLSTPDRRGLRWAGLIDDVIGFDADFFGITPREAVSMDPQQRLLLEVAWEALEDAGIVPESLAGSDTGVFVGVTNTDYLQLVTSGDLDKVDVYCTTGNGHCFPAGRLSYVLGLHGPAAAVDTACSSSLSALHLACQSLRTGEVRLAITGGVNLLLSAPTAQLIAATQALSPDGRCRAFDAEANGIVRGEGCGVIVLKRLSDAQASGDRIWALVRGTAMNHDGRSTGLTAPSVRAQELLLQSALRRAGVEPSSIGYIEAHGTGTSLGDPIELEALSAVVGKPRADGSTCALGTVKANIGHLEAAAGIAGVIKAILCLHQGTIPALKHFSRLNPRIDLGGTCFSIPTEVAPWPKGAAPRRAGVSAFGFSGTNAHAILEEPPARASDAAAEDAVHVLPLSARTPEALNARLREMAAAIEQGTLPLRDVCHTAAFRRTHHAERATFVFREGAQLVEQLRACADDEPCVGARRGRAGAQRPRVVFVYPGQGGQWAGMGKSLLESSAFRTRLEECDAAVRRHGGPSVVDAIASDVALEAIDVIQPVLFSLSVALTALFASWGIAPDAVLGHSMGEVAAAHVAGVLSLDDAARIICARSKLLRRVAGKGAMAVVELPMDATQAELAGREHLLSVAVSNSRNSTVIAGDPTALGELRESLEARGISCRRLLKIDVASHSPQMDPLRGDLLAALGTIPTSPSKVTLRSTVTGAVVAGHEFDAAYWVRNLREPVLFAETATHLVREGCTVFVELGPHPVLLSGLAALLQDESVRGLTLPALRSGEDERSILLESLGALHTVGVPVDWAAIAPPSGRVVSLPPYPFQKEPFWFEEDGPVAATGSVVASGHPLLGSSVTPASEPGTWIWQRQLDRATSYLADHRVEGAALLPGAAYLEMALCAGREVLGADVPFAIRDVAFEQMLPLPGGPEEPSPVVQLSWRPNDANDGNSEAAFEIVARTGASEDWSRHARGTVVEGGGPASALDLGKLRGRFADETRLDQGDVYRAFSEHRLDYGPSFRLVEEIVCTEGEALGRLRVPARLRDRSYAVHPALLDGCLQVLGTLVARRVGEGPSALVGEGLEAFRFHAHPGTAPWVHAKLRADGDDALIGDLTVFDADGRICIEASGLRTHVLEAGARPARNWRGWLLELAWRRRALPPSPPSRAERWCIVGDPDGLAGELARRLSARGESCMRAPADGPMPADIGHVVYVSSRPLQATSDAPDEAMRACVELSSLIRAMTQTPQARRLWLVTEGACAVDEGDGATIRPQASALWGFALAVTYEHPELSCTRIDVEPNAPPASLDALAHECWARTGDDLVALRAGARHVGRISERVAPLRLRNAPLRSDGTYLITGGLRGLGLSLAQNLIARGVRHVVLAGRSEASPAARAAMESWRALGAQVEPVQADVSDEASVAAMLARVEREMPPLVGIVHAAVAMDDGLAISVDEAKLRTVFAGKVQGALTLHRATCHLPLDFFVLYSSAASLVGNPGQATYGAANAYIDALAHRWRAEGLTAVSINWGAFAETGLAVTELARFEALGLRPITPEEGFDLFDDLRRIGVAQIAAVPSRDRLAAWAAQAPATRLFDELRTLVKKAARPVAAPSAAPAEDFSSALASAVSDEERRLLAVAHVRGEVARVFRRPSVRVPVDVPLSELGLDSMMALELRNRMRGSAVTIAALLRGPTVEDVAQKLLAGWHSAQAPVALATSTPGTEPLSASQKSLWYIQRLDPTSGAYNIPFALRMESSVARERLPSALSALMERHALLRSRLGGDDASPQWEIVAGAAAPFTAVDARGFDDAALEAAMARAIDAPFDLAAELPWRALAFDRADGSSLVVVVVHHIVTDFWSLSILFDDLRAILASSALPVLQASYGDFVRWQNELARSAEGERQWEYWKGALAGGPRALVLPTDRPRPAVQAFRGAAARFEIDAAVTSALRALAHRAGTTLYVVLLAAYHTLLARRAGQDDVIVGSPTAGRFRSELERVFGYFVNPIALRANLSDDPPFTVLLDRVRVAVHEALEHADLPFSNVVERLGVARDASRSPVFQVMFVLQRTVPVLAHIADFMLCVPGARCDVDGGTLAAVAVDDKAAPFELTLYVTEAGDGLRGQLQYNTGLFDATTAAAIARDYATLLKEVGIDAERSCKRLPLDARAAAEGLPVARAAREPHGEDRTLHAIFLEHVAAAPHAVAVIDGEKTLSYRELAERAQRLAAHLRRCGVVAESAVGLCLERSAELIVATLAIAMAGGFYVPLDPAYPAARRERMRADSGARLVVCSRSTESAVPAGARAIVLEALPQDAGAEPLPELEPLGPDALAYVMYTSGSTGTPKGIAIPHRGVVRLVVDTDYVRIGPSARVAHLASISFDAATFEIWGALLNGGAVVIVPRDVVLQLHALGAFLERHRVSTMFVTAGLFNQIAREAPGALRTVDTVLVGGDVCEPRAVRAVRKAGARTILNGYGPTENTTFSTFHEVTDVDGDTVPIGRPIARSTAYILDAAMRPVPEGVVGELYVGGDGLARGYVNQPAMTSARFLPDEFDGRPGARMYRTGDLARWSDGAIVFLGRADRQVKVRGFRIELGEVEASLAQLAEVGGVIVLVDSTPDFGARLLAYVVPAPSAKAHVSPASLRAALRESLPEYMVPSAFVILERFPLTPNGKVDRAALPQPEIASTAQEDANLGLVETMLVDIWKSVLRLPKVGIHDNFFELGGDSILSIQIVAQANRAGLALTPSQLLVHQTIAALAAVAGPAGAAASRLPPEGPVEGEVALTPIQKWFFDLELEEPHYFNQAMLLALDEGISPSHLEQALAGVFAQHDALRLRFVRGPSGWVQRFDPDAVAPPLKRHDLAHLGPRERAEAIVSLTEAVQSSLTLDGALMGVAYLDLGPEAGSRLFWCVHHLAVDLVSWRILLADLAIALEQVRRGEPVQLGSKTSSYKAWSERLSAHAGAPAVVAQAAFWNEQAELSVPSLPLDHPGGDNRVASIERVQVALDAEQTRDFFAEVLPTVRARVDELLVAALAVALRRWSGAPRVRIAMEHHGRDELAGSVDTVRTVGWFTSLFPIVLELPEADAVSSLSAVKERLRAIPSGGIGYGLSSGPRGELPEVAFNYLGAMDDAVGGCKGLAPAAEAIGESWGPRNRRPFVLDVLGTVRDGKLTIELVYSRTLHARASIEQLAHHLDGALRELMQHAANALANLGPAKDIEAVYPLTPLQDGLLFYALHTPESAAYHEQIVYDLRGVDDPRALELAWRQTIARHPALRTRFAWEGLDAPVQVVERAVEVPWEEEDLRALDEAAREGRLSAILEDDRTRPFEPAHAPLLRLRWMRTGPSRGWLLASFHHLLVDGWSMAIVLKDVLASYDTAAYGAAPPGAPPRPFGDFVSWLSRRDMAATHDFWRARLAALPEPRNPWRRAPSSGVTEGARRSHHVFSVEVTRRLEAFARAERLTLNTVLQAAWALLVARASGAREVVQGMTISGRPTELAGAEAMVGSLIDTLPVRIVCTPAASVRTWLGGIQKELAELAPHAHVGLPALQKLAGVPSGRELFDTLVVFENYPAEHLLGDDASAPSRATVAGVRAIEQTHYPLTVVFAPVRSLELFLLWDAAQIDDAVVHRLPERVEAVLDELVADPGRRLDDVFEALARPERAQIERFARGTTRPIPEGRVHEWVAQRAASAPEAVAIVAGDRSVSYGALVEHAAGLAHRLSALGLSPEDRVALRFHRSAELVVAMLGVLWAGCAYVPLDPDAPPARARGMLEDAAVRAVLVPPGADLDVPEGVHVVRVDLDLRASGAPAAGDPASMAYAIFTSGSTGRPKAVAVEHRGLANLVRWHVEKFRLETDDVVGVVANPSFDASTWEIWPALAAGAALHMVPREVLAGPDEIIAFLEEHGVTTCFMPTPLAEVMLPALAEAPGSLRLLLTGGDRLRRVPGRELPFELVNNYGPTENTVVATSGPVRSGAGVPDIGGPIANVTVWVLDEAMRPVAIGAEGELCIGGSGLARGYLGRAAETAERFVPDPFATAAGARMYRTGDRVRWADDGTLYFIGRSDGQIKLRGHRIELGEIESALVRAPGVRDAAAHVVHDPHPRLVGYVVASSAPLDRAALDAALRAALPAVMVPSVLVELPALPLTSRGKIDRAALPAPASEDSGGYVEPRTDAERTLAAIWSAVLGVRRPGVRDDFFALGGDSIASIQIVGRARRAGLQLTTRDLFAHPTIEAVARLAVATEIAPPAARHADARALARGPVPFTPIQRWFFEQDIPDRHHFNQTVLLEVREPLDREALALALEAVVNGHAAFGLRFEEEGGVWRQHWAPPDASALRVEHHDLSRFAASARRARVEALGEALQARLDLAQGPIAAVATFDPSPGAGAWVLVTVHHLIVDVVSFGVLIDDLESAYAAIRAGAEPRLLPEVTSFPAWAERCAELARSEEIRQALPFWLETATAPVAALPCDIPGDAGSVASSRSVSATADEATTRALLGLTAEGRDVTDALVAALVLALAEETGERAFRLHLERHGRHDADASTDSSRTVGWFTSLHPVRIALEDPSDAARCMTDVAAQMLRVPHEGASFGLLRYIAGDEGLTSAAAPEISFNYIGRGERGANRAFSALDVAVGSAIGTLGRRAHKLDVIAQVQDGRLRIELGYSAERHTRASIARVGERMIAALERVLAAPRQASVLARLPAALAAALRARLPDLVDAYPATPMQQGLLFHGLFDERRAYVEQMRFRLRAPDGSPELDADALARAWQFAVDRHGALRTAFVLDTSPAFQVVAAHATVRVERVDLQGLLPAEQNARLAAMCEAQRAAAFEVDRAPLLRLLLARAGEGRVHLVVTYHHALLDGWSLPIVLADVADAYGALREGRRPAARPAPAPYRDYVTWLLERDADASREFWKAEFCDFRAPPPLSAPTYRPGASPGTCRTLVSRELTTRLSALARELRITMNTLLVGAFALVLARSTGEDDVVLGVTEAGRPPELAEVESMVGLFLNTLPLRLRLQPGMRADEFLRAVQERQLAVRSHGHVPLVQIRDWAGIPREVSLFEALFGFESFPFGEGWRAPIAIDEAASDLHTNYPLTVAVLPGAELEIRASFDGTQLDEGATARWLDRLCAVLAAIGEDPRRSVDDLPLMNAQDQRRALVEWNDTQRAFRSDATLHRLFDEQVAASPDAVAILDGEHRVTYRELACRSNRLAHRLLELGVRVEDEVGVCVRRSADSFAAVLAVLKAGAAYVPLDPTYPSEYLQHVAGASSMQVAITQSDLTSSLPRGVVCICLDDEAEAHELARMPERAPEVGVASDNLAYVVFTTGSTGVPKGVLGTHRGMVNRLSWMWELYPFEDGEVSSHKTALNFLDSFWEMFGGLLRGMATAIIPPDAVLDPSAFVDTLSRAGVTRLVLVPSLLRTMLDEPHLAERLPRLGTWTVSGEALGGDLAARFAAQLPGRTLLNLYGSTEMAADVTSYAVPSVRDPSAPMPIGRPIANVRAYVLDAAMRPVPPGVAGELCVGGEAICRGYRGMPALTAERFVPNPFRSGERLFRTRDRAVLEPDGTIVYLGRADHQVKIRGFRIELSAVEAMLCRQPNVRQAVAMVREDEPGQARLVAYVVRSDGVTEGASLREALVAHLPPYSVPSAIVVLDAIPTTASGKIRRDGLPKPVLHAAGDDRPFVAPGTRTEETLAGIFVAVLGLERVGANDDFFELGGHSLLATQVMVRVRSAFSVDLPVRALFDAPTVEELAARVEGARWLGDDTPTDSYAELEEGTL